MTVIQRRELPYCFGCTGQSGWGACKTSRPRRHRHGDLPAEDECSMWVCWKCAKPSKMVYEKRLAAASQAPATRVRTKPQRRVRS